MTTDSGYQRTPANVIQRITGVFTAREAIGVAITPMKQGEQSDDADEDDMDYHVQAHFLCLPDDTEKDTPLTGLTYGFSMRMGGLTRCSEEEFQTRIELLAGELAVFLHKARASGMKVFSTPETMEAFLDRESTVPEDATAH